MRRALFDYEARREFLSTPPPPGGNSSCVLRNDGLRMEGENGAPPRANATEPLTKRPEKEGAMATAHPTVAPHPESSPDRA
jgi:hypothetical protein